VTDCSTVGRTVEDHVDDLYHVPQFDPWSSIVDKFSILRISSIVERINKSRQCKKDPVRADVIGVV